MCPKIDIDIEVWDALKERAEPFVDDPNSVLRRLLELDRAAGSEAKQNPPARQKESGPAKRERKHRAPAGSLLPEREYELPILRALGREGGKAPAREVIAAVGEELGEKLTDLDRESLSTGDFRWENRVQFTRLRLKERGLIESGSPRGIWEISDRGSAFLKAAQKEDDGGQA
jgi:Mrr N-terminal domain